MNLTIPQQTAPALGIVFPGQGSQSVGMYADLASDHSVVADTFEEASDILGYDLWALCQSGPAEELNRTDRTQPAMFAAGVAAWRVWTEQGGPAPALMAGHSLGECTAVTCSGAMTFAAGVRLVEARARVMQEAVPEGVGAMAAILGLDSEQVVAICTEVRGNEVATAVNFNSPQQVVVAGHKAAIERVVAAAKEAGARRAVPLAVSVPSHSELMKPAAEAFAGILEEVNFSTPAIPVLNSANGKTYSSAADIRDGLAGQLYNPVRWVDTVNIMNRQGITTLVECGPGKVLVGLNKRIDKSMAAHALLDTDTVTAALAAVGEAG